MFDKVKQLYDLKKRADALKKELAQEIIEYEKGDIKVIISADMRVHELRYPKDVAEKELTEAINKAIEEIQKVAAKKMQGQLGDLSELMR